ncbi:dentin matrix acidic phosphoprotein 1-like [Coffea eugenioides]|uniref:dentin matrix acidic phosphoprotein 1-like n=1 Tax=Coffea eugenioides TaxID=49369 RepID=UPI000F60C2D9|nr:dentin matrix acidic phosphoprotein 1-like [Coffea eugenioides]
MGDNPWQTIDIHMHYGGYFKWKPRIRYTGEHVRVFCGWDPDELSVFEFQKMYQTIEHGVTNMNFWYSIPFHDLDVGVVSIKDDVDIELLTTCYEGLSEMHIYAERGPDPIEAEISSSSTVKGKDDIDLLVIGSEDNNDIPDINCRAKDICEEESSQMESNPAIMGPHREKIHDSGNKSKRKKATNDKKVKSQRVKLSARKSVKQLFKDKEEGDTSSEFRQSPTRKSAQETTQAERDPTSEQTDCRGEPTTQAERDPTSEQTDCRGEKTVHEGEEEDEVIPDYSYFPNWIREAVELPEDDDIFASLHGQGSTQASINIGSANSVGIGYVQQQENQQAKASKQADLDEHQQKQHENQQPKDNPGADLDEHQQQQENQQPKHTLEADLGQHQQQTQSKK